MGHFIKGELKIFICDFCEKEFTIKDIGKKNTFCATKSCKECRVLVRRQAGLARHNGGVNESEYFKKIQDGLVYLYGITGVAPTKQEFLVHIKMSSKTLAKILKSRSTNYLDLCDSLGIKPKGRSKFQQSVLFYLQTILIGKEIVSEKTFPTLKNPSTGAFLFYDFYVPDLSLIIECDGLQHIEEKHYYNNLAEINGNTPSYKTDKIKTDFACKENISIIRIPYKKAINLEYVQSFLKSYEAN